MTLRHYARSSKRHETRSRRGDRTVIGCRCMDTKYLLEFPLHHKYYIENNSTSNTDIDHLVPPRKMTGHHVNSCISTTSKDEKTCNVGRDSQDCKAYNGLCPAQRHDTASKMMRESRCHCPACSKLVTGMSSPRSRLFSVYRDADLI